MLTYEDYSGYVELDEEAGVFHGEVLGLRDVITFEGASVEELERAFRESVDDYIEYCAERGEEPDRPFSGRITLRLPSELHRRVTLKAKREGKSLNQWIRDRLSEAG